MDIRLEWQPGQNAWWLKTLYWVTETVTQPWGIITHVFSALVSVVPAFSSARGGNAVCDPGGAILVGQGVKSWVKDHVQEPRPFVVWLEKTHHIPVDEFYNLKRKDRALVKEQLRNSRIFQVFT
jgi:phosphatidylglycerophosphatase B